MIDTHCHIDEEAFDADREEVIARQREAGVQAMVVPGVNAASVQTVMDVCHAHPGYCYPALGLHPEEVKGDWEQQLAVVEQAIRARRSELVAIGEIGLDYYWDKTYREEQQQVLRRQLLLACELNLPVILHNREATEDILKILQTFKPSNPQTLKQTDCSPLRGVFHCFNGSKETAVQILDMGFYLGIGGVLTFKNCKLGETLAELNNTLPLLYSPFRGTGGLGGGGLGERLLLETDAPYMAPVPHRGERNESRFMEHVAERLSAVLDCSKEEIIDATSGNARQLLGLK